MFQLLDYCLVMVFGNVVRSSIEILSIIKHLIRSRLNLIVMDAMITINCEIYPHKYITNETNSIGAFLLLYLLFMVDYYVLSRVFLSSFDFAKELST